MHCKSLPPTPTCSLYAKTFKKTQIPVYDALGPFPDEPLMTSIDRVLFLFGGRKVRKYFNSECFSVGSGKSDCCSTINSQMEHKAHHNYSNDQCYVQKSPTYSVIQKLKSSKYDMRSNKSTSFQESSLSPRCNTPRISINENSCRQESGKIGIPLRVLKRSFSLCSLACRKLKEKLSLAQSSLQSRPPSSPQWLWTKMEIYADGCQIFEVFKNSNAATHPTKFDTCKASKIIFVILPTGIIMPFETLGRY